MFYLIKIIFKKILILKKIFILKKLFLSKKKKKFLIKRKIISFRLDKWKFLRHTKKRI